MTETNFTHGKIYTFDETIPQAHGFSIKDGIIQSVYGEQESPRHEAGVMDLGGRAVLPAFTDAHVHLKMLAETLIGVDLLLSRSEPHAIELLQEWATRHNMAPGDWIIGRGWAFNLWEPDTLPTRRSLDRVFPDNPVYLSSQCGHLVWVNTAALRIAGLEHPSAGIREKWGAQIMYFDDGTPSGVLREDAEELVYDHLPALSEQELIQLVGKTIATLNRDGIFSVHNMEPRDSFELILKAFKQLPEFPMRVASYIQTDDVDWLARTAKEINEDPAFREYMRVEGIKLFVDGSLGGRTAWLEEPYNTAPDFRGIYLNTYESLLPLVYETNKRGLAAAVHAIGDRAIVEILRVFEDVAKKLQAEKRPVVQNRIEHFQMVNDTILEMTQRVKPCASMQPRHIPCDWRAADTHWGERARGAYACASLIKHGAPLLLGSDTPVVPPNPWETVYLTVTRKDFNGEPEGGWYPEEKLTREESLRAFTATPPRHAGFMRSGRLAQGYYGDFVVLSDDPFSIEENKLHTIQPVGGYFEGRKIFGDI